MYDVVVAGAGVAGASVAARLARGGRSVCLIDRATFPRRKVCGEGLFSRGVEVLDELGVLAELLPRARVIESLRLEAGGAAAEAPVGRGGPPAIGVRREVLDAALLDLAQRRGVELALGVTANGLLPGGAGYGGVRSDHGDFAAKCIVLADGLRSGLRRTADLDVTGAGRRYGVSAHYELSDAPPRIRIRLERGHEVYVTPVGAGLVNVALLLDKPAAAALSGRLVDGYESLVRASGVLGEGARLIDAPLAAGPFPARARRAWRDNLLLAGDAAGFFDGISGEGMSLALVSSAPAALAVQRFLDDGSTEHFAAYERARRRAGRNSTLLARVSLLLAAHPRLGRRLIVNLGRRPATFEKLLALNAGSAGLSTLRPRDIAAVLLGL